jgi:hypothetical protein
MSFSDSIHYLNIICPFAEQSGGWENTTFSCNPVNEYITQSLPSSFT